ncbi:unnamed protein product [Cyclocybe aegerita]|uniref:Uncharacterized protein n=1 Tax=Cyclocybe aegerita TaxID=1973307 RepID=A0A8S0W0U4_CYCAE|nr:unnamed protein product [Cyclocybe aegerita]
MPVSKEQHEEAMEIVLRKALEAQATAETALMLLEQENRFQADKNIELQERLAAVTKEKDEKQSSRAEFTFVGVASACKRTSFSLKGNSEFQQRMEAEIQHLGVAVYSISTQLE